MDIFKQFLLNLLKLIIYTVIIISGIVCFAEIYNMVDISNEVVGKPITIQDKENVEEFARYELGYIDFEKESDKYSVTYFYDAMKFDGSKEDYVIFFNGTKLVDTQSAGTISTTLEKKFYNSNGEVDAEISISILIDFSATQTRIAFETTDSGEDIAYFNTYQNINGTTIVVAKEI